MPYSVLRIPYSVFSFPFHVVLLGHLSWKQIMLMEYSVAIRCCIYWNASPAWFGILIWCHCALHFFFSGCIALQNISSFLPFVAFHKIFCSLLHCTNGTLNQGDHWSGILMDAMSSEVFGFCICICICICHCTVFAIHISMQLYGNSQSGWSGILIAIDAMSSTVFVFVFEFVSVFVQYLSYIFHGSSMGILNQGDLAFS